MMMMLINSRADAPRIHDSISILYPGKTRPCHDCCRQLQIFPDWMNGSEVTSRHHHHLLPGAPKCSLHQHSSLYISICCSVYDKVWQESVRRSCYSPQNIGFHDLGTPATWQIKSFILTRWYVLLRCQGLHFTLLLLNMNLPLKLLVMCLVF